MTSITINLTHSQISALKADRKRCAELINEGRCCEMLDLGLSVIDLHGLLVTIERELTKQNK